MLQDYKDVIIRNFVILVRECDVDAVAKLMVKKGVFTEKERKDIFSTEDARHNKRVFFFSIQKKETSAFKILVNSLRETNQNTLADLLMPKRTGCVPYQEEQVFDELPENIVDISKLNLYIDPSTESLNVKVIPSTKFYDTYLENPNIDFYYTRSKKRGRLLIINNYEFDKTSDETERPFRKGATVDNENLKSLFNQMGGWDIELHNNKSAEEMDTILNNFAQHPTNVNYDIVFVIIMSHGSEHANDTIIYGRDHMYIHSLNVQRKFSSDHSRSLRGKAKVFIIPVCRGSVLDLVIEHNLPRTETDSACRKGDSVSPVSSVTNIRSEEDMLVGYSTLLGYKAHRDPNRGSWYIELMCDVFMNHAHNTPVDNLLSMIDNRLRRRMSENRTMQTAEHRNKGFKKLYLHPGIYSEKDQLKMFEE